jgi:hypothetical protein
MDLQEEGEEEGRERGRQLKDAERPFNGGEPDFRRAAQRSTQQ